jgi:hypothetical protein
MSAKASAANTAARASAMRRAVAEAASAARPPASTGKNRTTNGVGAKPNRSARAVPARISTAIIGGWSK